ncbi:hypothetical protein SEUCBS139899_010662 [Sporothrix eucalyptigena]
MLRCSDTILSIVPNGIVLFVVAWRLYILASRNTKVVVVWPFLGALKLALFAVQSAVQLAIIIFQATGHGVLERTTLAADVLPLAATLILLALSYFEHSRTVRPSAIIQLFFFFTIIFDLPRLRTLWLLEGNSQNVIASLFTATAGVKVALLQIESVKKWTHAVSIKPEDIAPEERQGVFSRVFFFWLMPMFFKGYRRDLTMDDLFAIDADLQGTILYERLQKSWKAVDQSKKHSLTSAVIWTFSPELGTALIPRLGFAAFSLAQPYLISSMLYYITNQSTLPVSYGYGLIGAYAFVYTGMGLCQRLWMQVAFRAMTKIRGSLVTSIYRKMLVIRAETGNSGAAVSLMGTDVDRIVLTTFMTVNLIPDVVQLVIALGILGHKIGSTAVAPVILCAICVGIAAYLGKLVPPRQRRWMAAIQKRVGITADIISSIKGVKVAGLTDKVDEQIQGLRDYELDRSVQFRRMQITTQLLGTAPTLLMPAVTFTVYAIAQKLSGGGQFDVSQAFTSLSLLNVLVTPVMDLTQAWTTLSSAMACLDRIQAFFLRENRTDYRIHVSPSDSMSLSDTSEKKVDKPYPSSLDNDMEPVIKIRNGSFGWTKDGGPETAVLKDITLDIQPGQLTMLVGPVASGKTSLLEAIVGEARILGGSVEFTIPAHVAYCGQDAWLLNQSVRDNILAFEPYSAVFYKEVLAACQLEDDLRQFPKGDASIIGSRGISLSGGQKQRVALARALYNRKPVVILDDILKGLDADTYAKCFTAILGPNGILRRGRMAVIMATHNIQLLPHAEHIVVLEDGRVREQGSFNYLNSLDGSFVSGLGLKASDLKSVAVQDNIKEIEVEEEASDIVRKRVNALVIERTTAPDAMSQQSKDSDEPDAVDESKKKSRGKRNSDALFSYVRSMGRVQFPIFCAFTFCNIGFRSAQPLWLNVWTDANEVHPDAKLGYYAGIYVMFGALNVVFLALQFWIFMIKIVPYSAKVLHRRVLTACMRAPLTFFVMTDTGEIVNRFSQDMTLVDLQLPQSFMQSYQQVINALSQIVLTCVSSGYLAISVPVMLSVLFILQKFYLRTSRQIRLLDLEAKSPLYSHFISSFAGLTALRAYGWSQLAKDDNLARLNESQRPFYLLRCVQRWLTMALNLIVAGLAVLLVAISVALREKVNPGLLGVALTSVMTLGQTLSQLIQSWTMLETSLGAVTRINNFAADTPREPDGPTRQPPPPNWPNGGAISIRGLGAKYGAYTALDNISLDIAPGEKIAVCGRSGSGKSTLVTMLLRLYEPAAGSIVIDGIDTGTLNLNALRTSLVALPQDPMFLAGTVRYNLDPIGRLSEAELLSALDQIGIRDVVLDKLGGLDADLNTDLLSAGQRQLFCLARAMLRHSKVILLDEATSSLDRETEARVDYLVRTLFKGWTAIVVAHRLRTIADFDKVLVLQDGRIVEYDSPTNLLQDPNSKFKMLWDLQES